MKQSGSITSPPRDREPGCVFCDLPEGRNIEAENDLAVLIRDGFPVTEFHSLVIPKRHVAPKVRQTLVCRTRFPRTLQTRGGLKVVHRVR